VRGKIALAVAENNHCDYSLSAHTLVSTPVSARLKSHGCGRAGRRSQCDAAIHFAQRLLESRGHPTDTELAAARQAGFNDGEIVEVVAITALNVFTKCLNRVAETDIDFPVVRSGTGTAA
jgi:alkylhydroperoxidase family enzyme